MEGDIPICQINNRLQHLATATRNLVQHRLPYFIETCSYGSNQQYSSIGLDNGLAPARRQAIIWTNDSWFTDAYMWHLASMS